MSRKFQKTRKKISLHISAVPKLASASNQVSDEHLDECNVGSEKNYTKTPIEPKGEYIPCLHKILPMPINAGNFVVPPLPPKAIAKHIEGRDVEAISSYGVPQDDLSQELPSQKRASKKPLRFASETGMDPFSFFPPEDDINPASSTSKAVKKPFRFAPETGMDPFSFFPPEDDISPASSTSKAVKKPFRFAPEAGMDPFSFFPPEDDINPASSTENVIIHFSPELDMTQFSSLLGVDESL